MKKVSRPFIIAPAIVAALLLAYTAIHYALRPPDYRCDHALESLLVDVAEFPSGSTASAPSPLPTFETSTGTRARACESHYGGTFGHAFHVVYQFEDEDSAWRAYSQLIGTVFRARAELDLPWTESTYIAAAAVYADEVNAACTDRIGMGPRCTALARYGRWLSLFETEMDPSEMTSYDLVRILEVIDRLLVQSKMADPD